MKSHQQSDKEIVLELNSQISNNVINKVEHEVRYWTEKENEEVKLPTIIKKLLQFKFVKDFMFIETLISGFEILRILMPEVFFKYIV